MTGNGLAFKLRAALAGTLRIVPFAVSMVLMVILWGACGGGVFPEASNSSSPTSTSTKTPGLGNFLYVTQNGTGSVAEYSRNPSTGALTTIGKIGAGAINGPVGLGTASSSSLFIYVANSATATGNVYEYSLSNVNGELTALGGSPVSAAAAPQWVAITPDGDYAYVTNLTGGSVTQYTVSSGVLTANSPANVFTDLAAPYGAAATDDFLFVTDKTNADVVVFPIDSTNGTLGSPTPISLGVVGAIPGQITIDANQEFAFATDTQLGLVYSFIISGTGLTLVAGYPTAVAGTNSSTGVTAVITQPSSSVTNEFVYIANPASSTLTQYTVTPATGVLASGVQYTKFKLDEPWGVAAITDTTSGNSYLYVTNAGNGVISVFSIDPTTGALTAKGTLSSGADTTPLFPLIAY